VIGRDRWRSEPPCVYPPAKAGHMAKRRVGAESVRPGAVSPDRALCLPTFRHFVIGNKASLSLSVSLEARMNGAPSWKDGWSRSWASLVFAAHDSPNTC
jgi:hypothetical protein